MFKVYPYKQGSKSAKALAAALGCKVVKHEGKPLKFNGLLINWGSSNIKREIGGVHVMLNSPVRINIASNKLKSFDSLKEGDVCIPEYTTDRKVAEEWLDAGKTVVVRTKLNGHSGEGILIVEPAEGKGGLVPAPLYVKYVPKNNEYRVHVCHGVPFFIQRKARNRDVEDEKVNWQVRNHQNGFIYAHKDVEVSEEVKKQAIAAIATIGLDFGAVDIIETKAGKAYVLEVNTACGLEGTTLDKYVEQFKKVVNELA